MIVRGIGPRQGAIHLTITDRRGEKVGPTDGRPAALVSGRASGGAGGAASARALAVAEAANLTAHLVLALSDQVDGEGRRVRDHGGSSGGGGSERQRAAGRRAQVQGAGAGLVIRLLICCWRMARCSSLSSLREASGQAAVQSSVWRPVLRRSCAGPSRHPRERRRLSRAPSSSTLGACRHLRGEPLTRDPEAVDQCRRVRAQLAAEVVDRAGHRLGRAGVSRPCSRNQPRSDSISESA